MSKDDLHAPEPHPGPDYPQGALPEEPQGQEVGGFGGGTKVHRMKLVFLELLEAKDTRVLLRMRLQALFTSRADTGGDESCNRFGGITRDHRRIMETFSILEAEFQRRIRQPFDIIEAKYTRAVVARTLYLKLLAVYKAEFHRGFLEFYDIPESENTKDLLKKRFKARLISKGDTDEAVLQGKRACIKYKGVWHAP